MDSRAIRIFLAVIATGMLVGVISLLIVESRAVTTTYHVEHAERMRSLASVRDDLETVVDGARAAFRQGQGVPATVDLVLTELSAGRDALEGLAGVPRVGPELLNRVDDFNAAVTRTIDDGNAFAAQQETLAEALGAFQEEAPTLARYLGDQGADGSVQGVLAAAIDVFEHATSRSPGDPDALTARITELGESLDADEFAATQVSAFTAAASAVIAEHAKSVSALQQLERSAAAANPEALGTAIRSLDAITVSRVERARLLLAICAVLLLAAAAFAIARLQSSYRELNKINLSLEERVDERTEQLTKAYEELKESQVQLIHAEKMSSLGEMVAGISHEINTPLWYLMNNSSVLKDRLGTMSELCDVADEMLDAARSRSDVNQRIGQGLVQLNRLMGEGIRDDIEEAKELTQDNIDGLDDLTALAQGLKDFSRLDRAQQGTFDVNEGLERTLLIAKNKLKNKATIHKQFGQLPNIYCSPSQINQVFLNLLTNAADAIEEHGDITITTRMSNGRVEIDVADTGCGIEASTLEKIRDPFFTTKDVGQGTGLGLSIVDRIVSEHSGDLTIESEPGKGTTVTIALPIGANDEMPDISSAIERGIDLSLDTNVLHSTLTPTEPVRDAVSA